MGKNPIVKRILGILIILAIIWLLIDIFGFPIFTFTSTVSEEELVVGALEETGDENINKISPLKVELVSFDRSFDDQSMIIEVKNIDEYLGEVTVNLICEKKTSIQSITQLLPSGNTGVFEFKDVSKDCNDYEINPGEVEED